MEIGKLRESSKPVRCAYCHAPAGVEAVVCEGCGTQLHPECVKALTSCPTLGCQRFPGDRKRAPSAASSIVFVVLVLAAVFTGGMFFTLMRNAPRSEDSNPPAVSNEPPGVGLGDEVGLERRRDPARLAHVTPPPFETASASEQANPEFAYWSDCGVGSFVTMSMDTDAAGNVSHMETTTTLVELTSTKAVVDARGALFMGGNRIEIPVTKREIPARAPGVRLETDFTKEPIEDLSIAGKTLPCRRLTTTHDQNGLKTTTTVWLSDTIPGHTAKLDSFTEGSLKCHTAMTATAFEKKERR